MTRSILSIQGAQPCDAIFGDLRTLHKQHPCDGSWTEGSRGRRGATSRHLSEGCTTSSTAQKSQLCFEKDQSVSQRPLLSEGRFLEAPLHPTAY